MTIGDPAIAGPRRGVFVKRTGVTTIAAAADGDEVYGRGPRPILAGAFGLVVTARQFYAACIAGATTMSAGNVVPAAGKFGVGAGGVYSAGAATKIGSQDAIGNIRLF
ncbi:hypothetical protein [Xanthobacter wiegelii]|uniref:hypothetical protein n=1 Tax=Xanthobacter wiegelii TaxID=3119913 RepID=UPI00372972AF